MLLKIEKRPLQSPIHIIWGPIALLAVIVSGFLKNHLEFLPSCAFHKLTGLPCVTCGGTRSLVALSQFRFFDSFLQNPLVMLGTLSLAVFSLILLVERMAGKTVTLALSEPLKKLLRVGLLLTVISSWVFLIVSDR